MEVSKLQPMRRDELVELALNMGNLSLDAGTKTGRRRGRPQKPVPRAFAADADGDSENDNNSDSDQPHASAYTVFAGQLRDVGDRQLLTNGRRKGSRSPSRKGSRSPGRRGRPRGQGGKARAGSRSRSRGRKGSKGSKSRSRSRSGSRGRKGTRKLVTRSKSRSRSRSPTGRATRRGATPPRARGGRTRKLADADRIYFSENESGPEVDGYDAITVTRFRSPLARLAGDGNEGGGDAETASERRSRMAREQERKDMDAQRRQEARNANQGGDDTETASERRSRTKREQERREQERKDMEAKRRQDARMDRERTDREKATNRPTKAQDAAVMRTTRSSAQNKR